MKDERRYQQDEVSAIFKAAASDRPGSGADGPPGRLSPADGLTLAELQAIGGEVGLASGRIAEAALALDVQRGALPRRTFLGIPIAVGRSVELPRAPSDHEWGVLVAELRETFGARGKEASRGGLRQWNNGNLHAYIEPTLRGHRLRLGTRKGDAPALNVVGLGGVLMGLFSLASGDGILAALSFILIGAGVFAFNALRLPRWARQREEQMEYIAGRAQAIVGSAIPMDSI